MSPVVPTSGRGRTVRWKSWIPVGLSLVASWMLWSSNAFRLSRLIPWIPESWRSTVAQYLVGLLPALAISCLLLAAGLVVYSRYGFPRLATLATGVLGPPLMASHLVHFVGLAQGNPVGIALSSIGLLCTSAFLALPARDIREARRGL